MTSRHYRHPPQQARRAARCFTNLRNFQVASSSVCPAQPEQRAPNLSTCCDTLTRVTFFCAFQNLPVISTQTPCPPRSPCRPLATLRRSTVPHPPPAFSSFSPAMLPISVQPFTAHPPLSIVLSRSRSTGQRENFRWLKLINIVGVCGCFYYFVCYGREWR